nr:Spy/CpxP family protein refolding chaperone [uncultured Rhodopila sp.]
MSFLNRTTVLPALLGAALLACPLAGVAAVNAPQTATKTMVTPRETVEQRIAGLHTALNITASEEADWNGVSKAMRENAAVLDKLLAERSAGGTAGMTALDDLNFYGKLARAHVEGLKALTDSFAILYAAMPDAQRKIADHVFTHFGHEKTAAHG